MFAKSGGILLDSNIKEEAKGDLKAYFAVANYRIEQIIERVKAEIQKLVDVQGQTISLMSIRGGYQLMLGTRSVDSILGIDISVLNDENKAKAMDILNRGIAEINLILVDATEYVQSVTKVPEGNTGEENQPSNGGLESGNSQSDTKLPDTKESAANVSDSANVFESKAPKTDDGANAVLPMTGIISALAGIGYFLKKREH